MSTTPPEGHDHPTNDPASTEYLDSSAGGPLASEPSAPPRSRRTTLLVAGGAIGLVGAGVATWAAVSFFSTGPQPAEALPASTVAYLSLDLDPSGGQKIDALRTLNKFPAFKDEVGIGTGDDIKQKIFDDLTQGSDCGLDYAKDVEPWLGDRIAIAGVDQGGDTPVPVVVVQVSDQDAAKTGLATLLSCGGEDAGAAAFEDGWAVVAETQDQADQVVSDADKGTLADDATYQKWTDAAGDAGIVSAYAAPAAGRMISDGLGGVSSDLTGSSDAAQAADMFRDFDGAAMTVRFGNGSLEMELASSDSLAGGTTLGTDQGGEMVRSLPEDTALAVGVGLQDGWFGQYVDQVAKLSGGTTADEMMRDLSQMTGLDLPADAETLTGDSAAFAVSRDFDANAAESSSDMSGVPVALKVKGDPAAVQKVLAKLAGQDPTAEAITGSDVDGDVIAIGPDADYRKQVLSDGDLGDSDRFQEVLPDADKASALVYVDFGIMDSMIADLGADDPSITDNLKPLQALGLASWMDGHTVHVRLKLTTD